MDFSLEYNKEQAQFAKEVRGWLDKNATASPSPQRDPVKLTREHFEERRELARKLGQKGWLYPEFPRQYGGGSLDAAMCAVLYHELNDRGWGLPPHYDSGRLAAPAILACGTDDQKQRFLPSILRGEAVTWQLFTEPEAGTDEANQQTNALRHERDGEYFVIRGQKIFVGGLYAPPHQFLLLTRSDLQAPRHQNLAMFLAPANLPGVTIQPLDLFPSHILMGVSGQSPLTAPGVKHAVYFDDVRVHESFLIGGERDGWKVTSATLAVEHGERGRGGSESSTGSRWIPRNILVEKFLQQCRKNPKVVKRLEENPQLLENVLNVYMYGQIERLFATRNAAGKGGRYGGPQLQAHQKLRGGSMVADIAAVLGAYAFTEVGKWGLDGGIFEVGERSAVCMAPAGTPEAGRIIISRALGIGR